MHFLVLHWVTCEIFFLFYQKIWVADPGVFYGSNSDLREKINEIASPKFQESQYTCVTIIFYKNISQPKWRLPIFVLLYNIYCILYFSVYQSFYVFVCICLFVYRPVHWSSNMVNFSFSARFSSTFQKLSGSFF